MFLGCYLWKEDALQEISATFSDVLTEKLGLTHVLEHEIRLKTHYRWVTPYGVAFPKIHFLRKHMGKVLEDMVVELLEF